MRSIGEWAGSRGTDWMDRPIALPYSPALFRAIRSTALSTSRLCLSPHPSPLSPSKISIFCHFSPFFAPKNRRSHIVHALFTFVHHFSLVFSHFKRKKAIVNNALRWLILSDFNGDDARDDGDDGDGDVRRRYAQRDNAPRRTPPPRPQAPRSRAKYRAPSILHGFCALFHYAPPRK